MEFRQALRQLGVRDDTLTITEKERLDRDGYLPLEGMYTREQAARMLAEQAKGVAVLKGAGTVIVGSASDSAATGDEMDVGVCAHGNPGMATAGMGDVLAGVIGGLFAPLVRQGSVDTALQAARLGTCLHSLAADRAVRQYGQMSLLATDLLPEVIALLAEAEGS